MDQISQGLAALIATPATTASVGALLLAIITLWYPTRFKLPLVFFIIYLIAGWLSQHIQLIALPFIAALGFTFYIAQHSEFNKYLRFLVGIGAILLAVGFFMHVIPGITNIHVINHLSFSPHSAPYSMYVNLDKPLVGFFILLFGVPLIQRAAQWREMLVKTLPLALIGCIIVLIAALSIKFVVFEPKFNAFFFIWAISNLFFTVVAEEALCRGFILRYGDILFSRFKLGQYLSLILVSAIFGILHYAGGWHYVVLATLAGLVYGYIYQKTRRIEASILTHFVLNALHFLLFTYPLMM